MYNLFLNRIYNYMYGIFPVCCMFAFVIYLGPSLYKLYFHMCDL
jgi:hypothetical protein